MKKGLFLFCPILIGSIGIALVRNDFNTPVKKKTQTENVSIAIGCAPSAEENIFPDKGGKFITILPGWGNHSYLITTPSDSAQLYFNQGLSMYYSYHSTEAIASFKEAAKFDSTCAMAYWAQALAMGPDYVSGYRYKMSSGVPAAVQLMNGSIGHTSAKERDLINAMNRRYNVNDAADKQRKRLNEDYAEALKPLVAKYPDDLDIKAFYLDAVMLVHPWSFWNNNGTPKPWTPELVQYCKDILKQEPHHPAGLHYYIHITEASPYTGSSLTKCRLVDKTLPRCGTHGAHVKPRIRAHRLLRKRG